MLFDGDRQPYDYRFLEVNKAFEKQTDLKNAVGKTIKEMAPQHEQYWFDIYGKVAKSGKPVRFENAAKAIGHYYEVYAFRVGNPSENHVGILFKDISERKNLEEQQAFLLKLSDALRTLKDSDEIEETVTRQTMNYFDADRCFYCQVKEGNAIIHRDAFRRDLPSVSGTYALQTFPVFAAMLNAGQPLVVHDVHTSDVVDETLRALCIGLELISFIDIPVIKKGQTVGIFCLVQTTPRKWTDIEVNLAQESADRIWSAVERSRAEDEVRRSEENYRAIINQTIAGVIKTDLDGNILFANNQFANVLGYTHEELLELTMSDIIYEKDRIRNDEMYDHLKHEGRAFQIEKRLLRKDGSYIWVNNQVSPVFDDKGKPYEAVIVSVDISQQKAIEKIKDEFISVASHELKTPLTSIRAYTDFLMESFDENKDVYHGELVSKLKRQVDRMIKLVSRLLDTSRISSSKLALTYGIFDLNQLLKECITEAQPAAAHHKLIFEPGDIANVHGDRERISQVITNLLSNAVKYSRGEDKVIITSRGMNDKVKVSIRDYGIGIKEESRHGIFRRFNRGTAPSDISGLGLGLYISMEIIKMHGGTMGVETPPAEKNGEAGKGSLFYFVLPYDQHKTAANGKTV
jgi:PAS domain S-box-containing protein